MTIKEKKNIEKAKKELLTVRAFLTGQREGKPDDVQQEYNEQIKKILFCVFDLMKAER